MSDFIDFATMTWTCHVCGEERPDSKISVFSRTVHPKDRDGNPIRARVRQNVRHCNDRIACIEGARHIQFVH